MLHVPTYIQQTSDGDGGGRIKRQQQQPDPANQFFDNVFQVSLLVGTSTYIGTYIMIID